MIRLRPVPVVFVTLYDLGLDRLLTAVKECDPECGPEVEEAWESVMMVGISYLASRYHGPR